MVVFKMRDSVPSLRYSPVCNVLRQWKTSLIPTYSLPYDYIFYELSYASLHLEGCCSNYALILHKYI